MLAPHLTDTNCEKLLARATHKTKRELLVLVAEIAPKPDVLAPPSGSCRSSDRNPQANTVRQAPKVLFPDRVVPAPEPAPAPASRSG